MARIRYLKPDFFLDEDIGYLTVTERLAYAGLWCHADREGRLEDRPRLLKAQIFPYDNLDMEPILATLASPKHTNPSESFILRYEVNGKKYIQILKFLDHQKPHHTEKKSTIPPPLTVNSTSIDGEYPVGMGKGMGKGMGNGEEEGKDEIILSAVADLPLLWNRICTSLPKCSKLTEKRKIHAKARLKERTIAEWESVFRMIEESAFLTGNNNRNWKADFDWIIKSPDNAVKVLEGKYSRALKGGGKPEPKGAAAVRAWAEKNVGP